MIYIVDNQMLIDVVARRKPHGERYADILLHMLSDNRLGHRAVAETESNPFRPLTEPENAIFLLAPR